VQISLPDPSGLSLESLATFLRVRQPGLLVDPLRAELIAGGKSNLTFLVTDGAGSQIVLRRPPLVHVLASAHDMRREAAVLNALHDTMIPVPELIELCEDVSVIGAPFYLMHYVPGVAFRRAEQLAALGAPRTKLVCERMIDMLVSLHSLEPAEVGLSDFGRPAGFLVRQVARWKAQMDASYSRELPGADELYKRLASSIPKESRASIVHGDYRLDNLLFDENHSIMAVLDWEMATLGEPLTDLALLVAYSKLTGELNTDPASQNAAFAPGYPSVEEILERYSLQTGTELPLMGFHLGLAYFKLATIIEGVYYRSLQTGSAFGCEDLNMRIRPLIAAGLTALKEKI